MAGTYRVIVPTVVRKAAKMDSDVADPPRLEAGAEIEVTDCVKVRAGKRAKVQRLHFAGGWVSERVWAELVKLPRAGGRIPTLIVSDRPGPGHRTRRYVVRTLDDDLDLHGSGRIGHVLGEPHGPVTP